ncbi:hypothetical protein RSAG8_12498, partial [Rhizoctonia solani AG-8 WAC10335]
MSGTSSATAPIPTDVDGPNCPVHHRQLRGKGDDDDNNEEDEDDQYKPLADELDSDLDMGASVMLVETPTKAPATTLKASMKASTKAFEKRAAVGNKLNAAKSTTGKTTPIALTTAQKNSQLTTAKPPTVKSTATQTKSPGLEKLRVGKGSNLYGLEVR